MIKQPWKTLLLTTVLLAAIGGTGFWWWITSGYVTTDDARIKADIVSVSAELTGRIESLTKAEGDRVERDEVLATLDRRELEIQIQQAEAEMDRLQSKVRQGTIGILTEDVHWRAIFYINLPTGVLSIVSGYYLLPRRAAKSSAAPLDLPGLLTMTVASVALLLGLNLGHELGWGSRLIAACSRFRSFRLRFSSSSSSSLRSRFWNSGIFAT